MVSIIVNENEAGQRLDRFLRKYLKNAPLSLVFKLVRKDVKVNGRRAGGDYMIAEGDRISLYMSEEQLAGLMKARTKGRARKTFGIVFEDENILIASKPKGLLTHGDAREKKDHLANQVIDYLIEKGEYDPRAERTFSPAPVNRIDRNTSGLVIFAKNYRALKDLNSMIRKRGCLGKIYLTIVSGEIDGPLTLKGAMTKDESRNRVSLSDNGKEMVTHVRPLKVSAEAKPAGAGPGTSTLCEVEIETGRTHQIRVQLAGAGHPIIGDVKYGSKSVNSHMRKKYRLESQLLHAYRIEFRECTESLRYLEGKTFTAELTKEFKEIKKDLFGERD